jgi:uncharacterized membrane protein YGL010W
MVSRSIGNWGVLAPNTIEYFPSVQRGGHHVLRQMTPPFRRRFAVYAEYHRDQRNCATHVVGTPLLFLAAVLPFSLLSVTIFGLHTTAAVLLVIPALLFWMILDLAIGVAILCAAFPLLLTAATISACVNTAWVWTMTAALIVIGWALEIVGHSIFERRRPARFDNPIHMLISPMFIVAKLLVALGFRRDLAAILSKKPEVMITDFSQHP